MNYIDILYKCSFGDKIILIMMKLIIIFISCFLIVGIFFPKDYLIWYCLLCILILFYIKINDDACYDYISNDIIKHYNKEYTIETLPLETQTIKIIVVILMLISIFNYLYPQYSGYNFLCCLNNIKKNEDYKINLNTELKLCKKQNINNKLEEKINLIEDDTINFDNLGSELDVFKTRIEPVKIEILKNNASVIKPVQVMHEPVNNKIKESLKHFNNTFS